MATKTLYISLKVKQQGVLPSWRVSFPRKTTRRDATMPTGRKRRMWILVEPRRSRNRAESWRDYYAIFPHRRQPDNLFTHIHKRDQLNIGDTLRSNSHNTFYLFYIARIFATRRRRRITDATVVLFLY